MIRAPLVDSEGFLRDNTFPLVGTKLQSYPTTIHTYLACSLTVIELNQILITEYSLQKISKYLELKNTLLKKIQ